MPPGTESPKEPKESKPRSPVRDGLAIVLGGLAALYLFNPTMGVFELIPDNIPVIGNLDEAAASIILLAALRHFGVDLAGVFLAAQEPLAKVQGGAAKDDKELPESPFETG